jgi:hypothetical protein
VAKSTTTRLDRAKDILRAAEVEPLADQPGMYLVSRKYIVNLNAVVDETKIQLCECPDHQYRGANRCKHILAAMIFSGVPEDKLEIPVDTPMCSECKQRPAAKRGVVAPGDDEAWPFDDTDKCSVCFLSQDFRAGQ